MRTTRKKEVERGKKKRRKKKTKRRESNEDVTVWFLWRLFLKSLVKEKFGELWWSFLEGTLGEA